MYQVPHKSSISEKRPRVPAWHPSDSDCTWSHDIKSIKTHCGTFFCKVRPKIMLWLPDYVVFSHVPSTILNSASGTPIYRSVAIIISLGNVSKPFSRSTNPRAILPCTSSLFCTIDLSQDIHPVCCSTPLPEPLLFFPEVTFYYSPHPCV